jgi:hypothetical protein
MIGIDIDVESIKDIRLFYVLCKVKYELHYLFGVKPRIFKTRKGYHVRIDVDVDFSKQLVIRQMYFDDEFHILYDVGRYSVFADSLLDVLFQSKITYMWNGLDIKQETKYVEEDVTESVC